MRPTKIDPQTPPYGALKKIAPVGLRVGRVADAICVTTRSLLYSYRLYSQEAESEAVPRENDGRCVYPNSLLGGVGQGLLSTETEEQRQGRPDDCARYGEVNESCVVR